MKKYLLFGICVVSLSSYAQTTYVTGPYGNNIATATTMGPVTIYSGPQGQPLGSSTTYGNTATYSKYHGETVGGVVQPPPPSYPTSEPVSPMPTPQGLGLPVPRGLLMP